MMKYSIVLLLILALAAGTAMAARDTVSFSGFTFTPLILTITEGDTVVFVLSVAHNALEVSEATWDVNGVTPLGGGFSVPDGGGLAVPAGVGTHYYVCTNHVFSFGMKARIEVQPAPVTLSSILVSSLVDRDGNIASTPDRIGKRWSLRIYKDSIGSGVVLDSVASGLSLLADSLPAGTYVAVEADSAYWTHISQTVDGSPLGLTGLNFRSITIGGGEAHTIDFLNYARNVIISSGFTFVPETLSVDSSDTVRFVLEDMHNAREVDSLSWAALDTVSNGGFEVPLGGGEVIPPLPGTYYYICVPHSLAGMKGVIVVRPPGTLALQINAGWNLLSMPFLPADSGVATNYPTAVSAAFIYDLGYQSQTMIGPGRGYWLKFGAAQEVSLDGGVISAETVAVSQGWNIVGSISEPVPAASIQSEPGGLITSAFFEYSLGYTSADTLQPGFGYWVKVGGAGSLILQAPPGSAPAAGLIRIVPVPDVPVATAPTGDGPASPRR